MSKPFVYNPPSSPLEFLHVDEFLLVVVKPAGLLSVPGRGEDKQDCLSVRVMEEYPDTLIVHRLDLDTSGIILFARGKKMQAALSQLFEKRQVEKRYEALVSGKIDASGEVNLPIIVDWPNRPKRKVDYETGQPAHTRYRLLAYDAASNTSRVELEPVTGRTHQLRMHMACIDHPILGDELYNPSTEGVERLMLHARLLEFTHPVSGEALQFNNPPPF